VNREVTFITSMVYIERNRHERSVRIVLLPRDDVARQPHRVVVSCLFTVDEGL